MIRFLFLLLFVLLIKGLSSQVLNDDQPLKTDEYSSLTRRIDLSEDPRLTKMVEMHTARNSRINGMQGYRLEVFSNSGSSAKDEAMKIKSNILSSFPDVNVYVKFISPDFKVRVGDFRTKTEALKLMKQMEGTYKSFIVADVINFPKLELLSK